MTRIQIKQHMKKKEYSTEDFVLFFYTRTFVMHNILKKSLTACSSVTVLDIHIALPTFKGLFKD